MRAKLES